MNICVFCSAAELDDRYTRPARDFAGRDLVVVVRRNGMS